MGLPANIVKAAALGTHQHSGTTPLADAELENMLEGIMNDRQEAALLLTVAGLGLRQQAGYRPPHSTAPAPPPSGFDIARPCGPKAVRHLLLMLGNYHPSLLPVWLAEIRQNNQRVPEEVIPILLGYGYKQAALQSQLFAIIGSRGPWLAEQSGTPQWRWVLDTETRIDDYDNSHDAWVDYFERLRKHDPHTARELLDRYWSQIDSRLKYALLLAMRTGLSIHDETFLLARIEEDWVLSGLSTRILISLPALEFGQNLCRIAGQMLIITRMGHRQQWVADFAWSHAFDNRPEQILRADARKLLETIEYRWTPQQILSFVPLSYWYHQRGLTPAILVEGAYNSTRPEQILEAWITRTIYEQDNDFAYELLLRVHPDRFGEAWRSRLIALLTTQQIEKVGIIWLDKLRSGIHDRHPAIPLLTQHQQRWSDEMMISFLASLERSFTMTARPLLIHSIRTLLMSVVPFFSLEMIDEIKRVLQLNKRPQLSESEMEIIDSIVTVLDFQQDMIRAIRNREV